MIKKVILVFKTHFDIGFTDTATNIIKTYKGKMTEDVKDTCEATKDLDKCKYIWTMPSWPLYKMLDLDCDSKSDNAKAVAKLVRRGQLKWHALPFTSHFDFCGIEDYLRGHRISQALAEEFQVENANTAKLTDVPGHGRMLPSLLNEMGIEFLHIGTNEFATPPDVPILFNWEGPDGKKVLTMFSKAAYGTSLEAPTDWEYPVWMALLHTHDNCGPQSKDILEKLIEKAKKMYPDAEIVTGSMDDFYRELVNTDLDIPTITSDLADTWIHGVGTYPSEVTMVRAARGILTRVEKALNMLKLEARDKIQEVINQAYFELLLFGEHTWGLDVKTHMGEERAYDKEEFLEFKESSIAKLMEFSWDEQRQRAEDALHLAKEAEKLFNQVIGQDDNKILVFNPAGKKESIYIDVEHLKEALVGKALRREDKVLVPEELNGRLHFYGEDLEPLQFTSYEIVDYNEQKEQETSIDKIENHRYYVTCDVKTGEIITVWDKKLEKNIIRKSDDAFLNYRYDRYGFTDINEFLRTYGYKFSDWGINDYGKKSYPDCEHLTYRPITTKVIVKDNNLIIEKTNNESAKEYGDAQKVITEISLPRHGDEIFISVSLINKQETLYGESGYISMPFAMNKPQILINKTGCMIDVKKDIAKDAGHVNYCIENAVVLADDDTAITVTSLDIPLLSIGEAGMFKFRGSYEERDETLFFNAFNNMWGTNFPQWFGGDFKFRFTITSHLKADIQEQYYQVLNKSENVLAMLSDMDAATTDMAKLFSIPEYLRPSALENHDGTYILRVRETQGKEHEVQIDIPKGIMNARVVNLKGDLLTKAQGDLLTYKAHEYGIYNIAWEEEDNNAI